MHEQIANVLGTVEKVMRKDHFFIHWLYSIDLVSYEYDFKSRQISF